MADDLPPLYPTYQEPLGPPRPVAGYLTYLIAKNKSVYCTAVLNAVRSTSEYRCEAPHGGRLNSWFQPAPPLVCSFIHFVHFALLSVCNGRAILRGR
jgi:hypothetical protein